VSPAKTYELIEIPFGGVDSGGPSNHVLDGDPYHPTKMGNYWGLSSPFKSIGSCCLLRPAHIHGQMLTIYTLYDRFPCKEMPFGGRFDTDSHNADMAIPPKPRFWGHK